MTADLTERRPIGRVLLACVAALLLTAIAAPAASAEFGLTATGRVTADASGRPDTQAGHHPFAISTTIQFKTKVLGGIVGPEENPKNVVVDLPAGLVGDPQSAPTCPTAAFEAGAAQGECADDTQVGMAKIRFVTGPQWFRIYNLTPQPGQPARFGARLEGAGPAAVMLLVASVRTGGDYGLTIASPLVESNTPFSEVSVDFWGVPADPGHDGERGTCLSRSRGPLPSCANPVSTAPRPFLSLPADCTAGPLTTTVRANSWEHPDLWASASFDHDVNGVPLAVEGCDQLIFRPSIDVRPDVTAAGSPTGLTVVLDVRQEDGATRLATPPLRRAVVRLPAGVAVSPSSAGGLAACAPAQIALSSATRPTCPEASKIGTVEIDTPLLAAPLRGSVFLARQNDNPFGTLLSLYLVAEGSGVLVKLPGRIDPDPLTGQLTATFDDNPQLPFSRLTMQLKAGPRAPLSLPAFCGAATTTAELTPWNSSEPVRVSSAFDVSSDGRGAACSPRGFAPGFVAGTTNPSAGRDTTLAVRFSRTDRDQLLGGIAIDMPRGVLARIADTTLCGEAEANAGTCGEASRIGQVTTAAGAGSDPFALPGRVYLTGPYKGAPFGLSVVVPAVAGPFNLGTVVVRAAVFVDRATAALRVVSDPLPTILAGIPLQIRLVEVKVDRAGFAFNPTSCAEQRFAGTIGSAEGARAAVSSRFQVGDCAALAFKPKMTLRIGAKGRTKPGITVPLRAVVQMTKGQANLRSVRVNLPKNINARLPVINRNACSLARYEAGDCPASLAVGSATAVTPLLRDPLSGKAFFVRNPARRIPDLVVALKGQVDIDLTGKVRIPRDLTLATTFDTIPDVPITKFALNLVAGRSGPIGTIGNLCSARVRSGMKAKLAFEGQNGRAVARTQKLRIAGCGRAKAKGRGKARARA